MNSGTLMLGWNSQPPVPLPNSSPSSLLALPAMAVRAMRGRKAARAAPICAWAARSCCSAAWMSGLRTSRSEGSPAGRGRSASAAGRRPAASGVGAPTIRSSACCCVARCCSSCATRACACWCSMRTWVRSSREVAPTSTRRPKMRSASARLSSARRASARRSSVSCRASQAFAVCATRLTVAPCCAQAAAKYWRSAASLRLRTRPHRSSSQLLMPMVAL